MYWDKSSKKDSYFVAWPLSTTIVSVKWCDASVFIVPNYNLFSPKLQFVRLQTRVFIKENCSLFISKLQQTTKDNKKTLCKSQRLPLKVLFVGIKHDLLLCSTFGHNSADNLLLGRCNGAFPFAHIIVGIAPKASD